MSKHTRKTPPRSGTRFPGITNAARSLQVSRTHLYLVLTGQRTSEGLLRRYYTIKKAA